MVVLVNQNPYRSPTLTTGVPLWSFSARSWEIQSTILLSGVTLEVYYLEIATVSAELFQNCSQAAI